MKSRLLKGKNAEYWIKKIERNMERDAEIDQKLFQMDWTVIRFWGEEIQKDTDKCVRIIEEAIFENLISQTADEPYAFDTIEVGESE